MVRTLDLTLRCYAEVFPESRSVEHESNDLCRAAAIEQWIAAIGEEEALASVNHSVAEVDQWEQAHFHEEELRNKAKGAKKKYEAALRFKLFGIPE